MSDRPIADHAFLSDCQAAAMVTSEGSVDWMCCPRFDSPSIFGRLLDDAAGHWSIRPAGAFTSSRRYVDRTLVLETTFHTPTGTMTLTDALAMGPDNRGHALGRDAPRVLIRSLDGVPGEVIVGFLPAREPRMLATIEAIAHRLTDENGLVYRYRAEDGVDGLVGTEGTFLLCTFWLAQALAMAGHVKQAREAFSRAAAFVNDVGLLAEEIESTTGEQMGNFPQAFSHIGLVNAAWAISQAEQRRQWR